MNYKHLPVYCRCGDTPECIDEVGFTDDHQLVIHWWCSRCQRVGWLAKPLAECWRECPPPGDSLERRLEQLYEMGLASDPEDARFLKSLGVKPS